VSEPVWTGDDESVRYDTSLPEALHGLTYDPETGEIYDLSGRRVVISLNMVDTQGLSQERTCSCDFGFMLIYGCRCGQDSNYYTRPPASLPSGEKGRIVLVDAAHTGPRPASDA
jgi:hypothetical protein